MCLTLCLEMRYLRMASRCGDFYYLGPVEPTKERFGLEGSPSSVAYLRMLGEPQSLPSMRLLLGSVTSLSSLDVSVRLR
eukprot:CAMPEP_0185585760 /NCGR_PEP_ID=MMETSP0434-20130131/40664_1 /TAXON_ID=626734 ORGANISM="Favella taraikaensis, Strain Fe Narragansett Bay" /NCGR_SAMPLE_ID=MMETSP0434 /ASSEMBLY_ACC=CAM_ASM_000379 /LENGTH=78 /DNA_ID=CAMNT_0028206323 /DNA_START=1013 /DNA_END=1249 /DNA_ORIENTATION=+